jgi:hypothetical protein
LDQGELAIRERLLRELHDELSNHARLRSGLRILTIPQVKDWLKEKTVDLHVFTPSNLEAAQEATSNVPLQMKCRAQDL